jgi:hypothetical protein
MVVSPPMPLPLGDPPDHEPPEAEHQRHRHDPGQQRGEGRRVRPARHCHAFRGEPVGDGGIDADRDEAASAIGLGRLQRALDPRLGDGDLRDVASRQSRLELAVGNRLDLAPDVPPRLEQQQQDEGPDEIPGVYLALAFRRHRRLSDQCARIPSPFRSILDLRQTDTHARLSRIRPIAPGGVILRRSGRADR